MAQAQKATQQQTKAHNSRLVLKTIYDRGRISRADVARLTHLTRTTVSDLVMDLQERGLVEEVGYGQSLGGRSPILLSVAEDAQHLISVDLADNELRGAVSNLRNEISASARVPVSGRGGEAALALVYDLIDRLMESTDRPLLGIGIGTPGLVDTTRGIVLSAVNLDWRDLPLGSLLQERYGLPTYIANDSQLAALAHYMAYAGEGVTRGENMVVVKVGQGIGAGILLNGRLFQGDGFGAGEIGHISVEEGGELCRCGNIGCLETVASLPAIARRVMSRVQANPTSALNSPDGDELASILRALRLGDAEALQLMVETGRYLGIALAHLVGTLNIRHIVVLGEVAAFGPPLLEMIRAEMMRRALPALARDTHIELVEPDPNAVIMGASALVLGHELGLSFVR
jgi:N-acetylglucosamine repressor